MSEIYAIMLTHRDDANCPKCGMLAHVVTCKEGTNMHTCKRCKVMYVPKELIKEMRKGLKKYKLVMIQTNGHQESITTVTGEDFDRYMFVDRAWHQLEDELDMPGITVDVDEPDDYGLAGGFVPVSNRLYEGDIDITDTIKDFPW